MTTDVQPIESADPAAAAFSRLEGEIALMRRAVENLATEKANIDIPDYSSTLGEMAQHLEAATKLLGTIADKPAMDLTPENMAQQMDHAARQGRQSDREQITAAENRYDHAMRALTRVVASAHTAADQRDRLKWVGGGGILAGCLLWAIIPGPIARSFPESWHMPEKIATRAIGEPSIWEAGVRLLRVGSPAAWRAISDAAEMRHRNRDVIRDCEEAALKSRRPVRCTVRIGPPDTANSLTWTASSGAFSATMRVKRRSRPAVQYFVANFGDLRLPIVRRRSPFPERSVRDVDQYRPALHESEAWYRWASPMCPRQSFLHRTGVHARLG